MKIQWGSVIVWGFLIVAAVVSTIAVAGGISFPADGVSVIQAIGKFLGIYAYLIFVMQYVWTAKTKFIEWLLPYDQRVAIHRSFGFLGVLAVTLHPVFVLGAYASLGAGFFLSLPLVLGFVALLLLLIVAGSTFLSRIWGVRYEVWKSIHWIAFVVLTLAFVHSIMIGSDMVGAFRVIWISIYALHVAIVVSKLVHKAILRSRRVSIAAVDEPVPGIRTIRFQRLGAEFRSGQFTFLKLKTDGRWSHWHPFSITSHPEDEHLSVAIKAAGDFTQSVNQVRAGDEAKIDPGYGGFTAEPYPDSRYVFIAAGIGIAPIYGILKDLKDRDPRPEVVLLYSAHTEGELLFRGDLDSWFSANPTWSSTYIVTSQPDWGGVSGRLTPERAEEMCGGTAKRTFYLCGPSRMIRSIAQHLRRLGVPGSGFGTSCLSFFRNQGAQHRVPHSWNLRL